ncbi:type II toxin-antitoxin system VapC family toxin [Microbacterium profundi]|uniref:Ribonuclease VapC n=2 Tax=Microbacteriaceae TaxID=85023 RepID=A0ABV3LKL1_9MICO|nr:type II toxin-antitoxin system VapC family toxin [Microbacterium profundi]MCE7480993.1 type II toxin-antitoxin system VapC family toxin [Microbacterium profundi]
MIVVDASIVLDHLLGDLDAAVSTRIDGADLAAPDLLDVEVASALRGLWLGHKVTEERVHTTIDDLARFEADRFASSMLIPRAMQLRENLTVYDATYVALAEVLECALLTRDRRIAAAPGIRCPVQVI